MPEYLDELEDKRNKVNLEAEAHRKKRDRMNQETKRFAETRDQLNAQVKKLLQEANKFKEKRDELNSKVREQKSVRDVLTRDYNALKAELDKQRKSRLSTHDEVSLSKLKKELKGLEFKQQTSVLEADKERGLVEKIGSLKHQVRKKEKLMEATGEMKELITKVRDAKTNMDDAHHQVNNYADLAQKEHDQMIDRFSQSDRIRKEADSAQENFVASKVKADEEHKYHIEMIHLVHDMDKILYALKQRRRSQEKKPGKAQSAPQAPSPATGKVEAEKIYEKFKKGDKISTEDLMLLQKYGFL